ncbi:desiccation-like protein [Perilla frutescens var. hirtella]|uniref:Desiccation-like protein n=1 Tax=Perilla frutescens var. hirtella TaxID=608512 RepID=A0AAD4JDN3_PERFH|nr:desiccation-like protein [Perilla frutescens var. hirtella]KAH6816790.1 desiccation-like protein [Perilla frutescens var. frutescens]KAH6831817.1 desiccation-like protein [Perilla frutescens var. hirtella]
MVEREKTAKQKASLKLAQLPDESFKFHGFINIDCVIIFDQEERIPVDDVPMSNGACSS